MATKEKENQSPTVTFDGKAYRLRFDYNAMVELCDALGARIDTLQEVMASLKVSQLSLVLWAGMLEAAPELSDPVEGPKAVKAMLGKLDVPDGQAIVQTALTAFTASSVRADKGGKGSAAESPPKAAANP